MSDLHACGWVRGEVIARAINKGFGNYQMDCKEVITLSDFYRTNIMVFQRQSEQVFLAKMLYAKERAIKTVYEIDDDLLNTPADFPGPFAYYTKPDIREVIKSFLRKADAVTCSTTPLAKALQPYTEGRPIYVVENMLDVEEWEFTCAKRLCEAPKKDTVTIGWMASGSHVQDVPIVSEALERIMSEHPEVTLHFIGWVGFTTIPWAQKYANRVLCEEWQNASILPEVMQNFDIGVAALTDNPYNSAKSNIKALQHWALGVPTVASPLLPYLDTIEDGKDGFLPQGNSPESWYQAFKMLVKSEPLRRQMGMAGRKKLLEKYDVRNNVTQWMKTFDRIMAI